MNRAWSTFDRDLQHLLVEVDESIGKEELDRLPELLAPPNAEDAVDATDDAAEAGAEGGQGADDLAVSGFSKRLVRQMLNSEVNFLMATLYTKEHAAALSAEAAGGAGGAAADVAMVADEGKPAAKGSGDADKPEDDYSDGGVLPSPKHVDASLLKRANVTRATLARLLRYLHDARERQAAIGQELEKAANAPESGDAEGGAGGVVSGEVQRLKSEVARLTTMHDELFRRMRESAAHVMLLQATVDKYDTRARAAIAARDEALEDARRAHRTLARIRVDNPGLKEYGVMVRDEAPKPAKRARTAASPAATPNGSVATPGPAGAGAGTGAAGGAGGAESGPASASPAPSTPAAAPEIVTNVEDAKEAERLRNLCEEHEATLKTVRAELDDALRERDTLRLRGANEAIIRASVLFRKSEEHAAAEMSARVKAESTLKEQTLELVEVRRRLEELLASVGHTDAAQEEQLKGRIAELTERVRKAEAEVADTKGKLATAEAGAARAQQLQKLIDEQKGLLAGLLAENSRLKKDRAASVSSRAPVASAIAQMKSKTDKLTEIVAAKDKEIDKLRTQYEDAERKLATAGTAGAGGDAVDARCAALTREAEAAASALAAAKASATRLRAEAEKSETALAAARGELVAVTEERDELMSEVEQISAAHEEMQAQNSKLLEAARLHELEVKAMRVAAATVETSKQQVATELLATRQKLEQSSHLAGALEGEVSQLRAYCASLEQKVQAAESIAAEAHLGAEAARLQARTATDTVQTLRRALEMVEEKLANAESVVADARADQKRMGDESDEARRAKSELEKKLSKAERALKKALKRKAGPMDKAQQQQFSALQKILKCSVCQENYVNAVITKCYHLFCRGCLDERVRRRNRKCPGCNKGFGADDVQTVYFG